MRDGHEGKKSLPLPQIEIEGACGSRIVVVHDPLCVGFHGLLCGRSAPAAKTRRSPKRDAGSDSARGHSDHKRRDQRNGARGPRRRAYHSKRRGNVGYRTQLCRSAHSSHLRGWGIFFLRLHKFELLFLFFFVVSLFIIFWFSIDGQVSHWVFRRFST